ncbi:MAG: ABC transporter permease [Spirochaetales bacterium]|nr:ABC transporter permease [Spirochaetales bacterium]
MKKKRIPASLPVLLLCLGAAALVIILFSKTPAQTLYYFFPGVAANRLYLGEMLNSLVLLSITGLAIVIAFNAGSFNLGGEGQVYTGAICAVLAARQLPDLPGIPGILLLILCGTAGGALLAFVSGVLKALWDVDDLISTFLLSSGVAKLIDYLIAGPLSDPASYLITTEPLPDKYRLPSLLIPSPFNISFILPLILLPLFHYYLNHTRQGYELQMTGSSSSFARHSGLNMGIYQTLPLTISGALHGLAGSLVLTGTYFAGIQGLTSGLGWNGIAVALIAGRKVPGILPAALFFAWMTQGSRIALLHSDLTLELGAVIQGILFLLISSSVLRLKFKNRPAGGSPS